MDRTGSPRRYRLEPARLDEHVRRAAGWLHGRGFRGGELVGMRVRNDPASLALALAALRSGIVPVVVREDLSPAERSWLLAGAGVREVIDRADPAAWEDAEPADVADVPLGRPVFFTSGTSGMPKGVSGGVLSQDLAAALAEDEQELWAPSPGGVWLVASPLHHSAGFRSATSALLAGSDVMLLERFDAETVIRLLAEESVTGTFLVPTHLRRMFALAGDGTAPPPRVARRILHAGEPCPEPLKRRALEWAPPGALWEFYGATEGQFTAISPEEWLERPGSVGRARRGRRLEIDPDGTVFVSAPEFARWEYLGDPEGTAAAWRDDLFTAGDLGRLDEDGYLYLESRREDLIVTGGVNVYPAEVERILAGNPWGYDAVVFSAADHEWGRRVCAAFVAPANVLAQIEAWVRQRLSGPRRPKTLVAVDELPRTGSGKLDRRALAEGLAGESAG